MAEISPTRMNLLARRSQLRLAAKGVDLLQKKRDALVKEFFDLVHGTLEARRQLNTAAGEAVTALLLARSFDGPEEVEAFSFRLPTLSEVEVRMDNVWGTRVPHVEAAWPREAAFSPIATGGQTLVAQDAFRRLSQALVEVANTENRMRRVGEEIKKTARRVNALERLVIPSIRSQIRSIQQVLEQREREDIFRLKRIKSRLAAQRQEQQPGHGDAASSG